VVIVRGLNGSEVELVHLAVVVTDCAWGEYCFIVLPTNEIYFVHFVTNGGLKMCFIFLWFFLRLYP
jgi:hypothetical protein